MGGIDVVQVALLLAIAGTPVSGVAAALLTKRYARRIARLTGQQYRRGRGAPRRTRARAAPADTPATETAEFALGSARRNSIVYLAGGGVFSVSAAVVLLLSQGADLGLNHQTVTLLVLLALSFGLPLVALVQLVNEHRPPLRAAMWVAWVGLVVLILLFGQGSQRQSPALVFALVVAPIAVTSLVIGTTAARRALRGVTWLLAPAVTTLVFVLVCLGGTTISGDTEVLLAASVLGGVVGGAFAALVWASYRARWASDQWVTMSLLWFYETVVLTYLVLFSHADAWLLSCLVPLLLYLVVVGFSFHRRPTRGLRPSIDILILRSFSERRANVSLLRNVELYWRHLGCVLLIGGTDLAAETLEPDELVDWATGQLRDRVIATPDQARPRLEELSFVPDADGRFRVHDLVCADEAWRETCSLAMQSVEAVLVDVRGLGAATSGLAWELDALAGMPRATIVGVASNDDERDALAPLRRAGHRLTVLDVDQREPTARALVLALGAAVERRPDHRDHEGAAR